MASFQPYTYNKLTAYTQQAALHKRYEPQMAVQPNAAFINPPKEILDSVYKSANSQQHQVKEEGGLFSAQMIDRQERHISSSSKILTIRSSHSTGSMKKQSLSPQPQIVLPKQNSFKAKETNLYNQSIQNDTQSTFSQKNANSTIGSSHQSINMTSSGSALTAQKHKELIQSKQRIQKQLMQLRAQSPNESATHSLRAQTEQSLERKTKSPQNSILHEKQNEQFFIPKSIGKSVLGSRDTGTQESLNLVSLELSKCNQSSSRNLIVSIPQNQQKISEIKTNNFPKVMKVKSEQTDEMQIKSQQFNKLDEKQQNITIFIHSNGLKIGPIILSTTGRNVEWLTKYLIQEIKILEEMRGQSLTKKNEDIFHFQSYNHSNISLSYYLTLKERPLCVFTHNKNPIYLEPFYAEKKSNQHTKGKNEIGLKDFNFIKCVGIGGFSRVYLVQKKDNGKMYALKLIDKKFIEENKKQGIVKNERNIMTIMQGQPFLLQLDYAFESNGYIAFAMEYCAGGEMFFHLRRLKNMTEEQARFYFIEICLGIQFLHNNHIIYRDIKPENILLDIDGHIRIGDFGLSKPDMDINEFAYSFCGSPEYMAPEMLLKIGHDYSVDHYTLGALLYEFITGLPPYYCQDTEKIYSSILNDELIFPSHMSKELKNLLTGLLTKSPSNRFGKKGGIQDILSHPWCRKISIDDILLKKMQPPISIDVVGFNFDEEEFQKGETEFRKKLTSQFFSQKFNPMFTPSFYYESPNLRQLNSLPQQQQLLQKQQLQQQQNQKQQQQLQQQKQQSQQQQQQSQEQEKQQPQQQQQQGNQKNIQIDPLDQQNKDQQFQGVKNNIVSSQSTEADEIQNQNKPMKRSFETNIFLKKQQGPVKVLPSNKIDLKTTISETIISHVNEEQKDNTEKSYQIITNTLSSTNEKQKKIGSYKFPVNTEIKTHGIKSPPALSLSKERKQSKSQEKTMVSTQKIDLFHVPKLQAPKLLNSTCEVTQEHPTEISGFSLEVTKSRMNTQGEHSEQGTPLLSSSRRNSRTKLIINSGILDIPSIQLSKVEMLEQTEPSQNSVFSLKTPHKYSMSEIKTALGVSLQQASVEQKKPSHCSNKSEQNLLKLKQSLSSSMLKGNLKAPEMLIQRLSNSQTRNDTKLKTPKMTQLSIQNRMCSEGTEQAATDSIFNIIMTKKLNRQNSVDENKIKKFSPSSNGLELQEVINSMDAQKILVSDGKNQKQTIRASSDVIRSIYNSYGNPQIDEAVNNVSINQKLVVPGSSFFGIQSILNNYGGTSQRGVEVSPKHMNDPNSQIKKISSPRVDKKQIIVNFSHLQSSSFSQKLLSSPRTPNTKQAFLKRASTSMKSSMNSLLNPTRVYSPLGFI